MTLTSAPEYWDTRGKPVVHRTIAVEDGALLVRLRVANVPAKGFEAVELVPAMVRGRPVTTEGRPVRPDATGALHLHVRYRASNVSRASVPDRDGADRPPRPVPPSLRAGPGPAPRTRADRTRPRALRALEIAPALRIPAGQRAWLPISGVNLDGRVDTDVAETLGRGWRWTSSNADVAVVARAHPDPDGGRDAASTYATVVARVPGHTTLSTTLAGRTSTVEVTVVAGGAGASTCEPGVFVPTARPLATSPASRRPAEGTLVAVGAGPPTARAEARTLVPLLGRPCAGASVVHVSAAAYLRLLSG